MSLNGRFKVYIDPYAPENKEPQAVGYKGTNKITNPQAICDYDNIVFPISDMGFFFCPYVPLQMMEHSLKYWDELVFNNMQIEFKTRYGIVSNPFKGSSNKYFKKVS